MLKYALWAARWTKRMQVLVSKSFKAFTIVCFSLASEIVEKVLHQWNGPVSVWKRHVNMRYPLPVMRYLKRSNPPYFLLKRKGISTFPLADFGHRQLNALFKHFIAFLVFGRTTSPSSRKSLDPIGKKNAFWSVRTSSHFCVCQKCVSYIINRFYYTEQLRQFCEKLMLSFPCNISLENSPLFILRIVSPTSSMSGFSTEISNQWKQSTSYTTVFSHWQTVLYLFDLVC